jgi:hypothetical protein
MVAAPRRYMSAFTALETSFVIGARKGGAGKREDFARTDVAQAAYERAVTGSRDGRGK